MCIIPKVGGRIDFNALQSISSSYNNAMKFKNMPLLAFLWADTCLISKV